MIKTINLNGREISYDLEYKNVKNINLRIKADQSIYMSANHRVSDKIIEEFLRSKADYILKALDHYAEIAKYAPKPKQYIDGESFRILGHDLRLKVVQGKRNTVESDESYITLTVKDSCNTELKKKTMDKWIKSNCKEVLLAVCESVYPKFQKYGVEFPELRFRNMVSRWGSCQPKRKILTFNISLVEAPMSCIEYVVTHEFTHFLQPNHSKKFYNQLAMFMPDWQERKKVLEKNNSFVEQVVNMRNQFLTNYTDITFLDKIKDNLRRCSSFAFSVSFIKKAGLVLLFKDIEAAVERGAKGRIITSTYQNFTDIESIKSFFALQCKHDNFECHLDYECFHDNHYSTLGYHSKGYLFEFNNNYEVIIGSSNITRYALLKNIEWDVVVREDTPEVYQQAMAEFEDKWEATHLLNSEIINLYSNKLNFAIERWDMDYDLSASNIKPNFMQRKALKELNRYRAVGTNRALVVAAAGSGKTYLAAFDALNFNPKRLLYIVHEGSILKKSLETFADVFGNSVTYGIFSGESKEMDADFVFATNITMCKSLELFSKNEFDYIIIDECHHATAKTYTDIINYFEPEFLLGLTATPERMDNEDVFELFDKNVPYELRLRDAIINDLVVPFKYYGIRDQLIDYGLSKSEERKMIAQLANDEHIEFISEQIEAHRCQGKLKALAFCRNVTHARMMCEAMEGRYKTAYLTGRNDIGERVRAYNDLQSDEAELEILFTVDILNEGVDIPGVNMVLFLRPTESSTIFIQQLGRGLRKYDNKPYVTVLDFIGNSYKRSVQIAFALGSLSKNLILEKKLMQQLVRDDFKALGLSEYGVEINVDDLSKEEIVNYIENENFNSLSYMKQDYFNFKKYINSEFYPKHMDFLNNDCAPDLLRFLSVKIGGKKNISYYNFLRGIEEENLPTFSEEQIAFANYLSAMLPLVRKHEYLIFDCLIKGIADLSDIENFLAQNINGYNSDEFEHALKYIYESGFVSCNGDELSLNIAMDSDFNEYLIDLLSYGLTRYFIDFGDENDFKLWQSYRMDQVQLKFLKNPQHNQVGTYYYGKEVIIFASLKKDLGEEDRLNYNDKFLEPALFQWESMANVSASDVEKQQNSDRAYLFIRKVSTENGIVLPFIYVGTGKMTNPRKQIKFDKAKGKDVVTYLYDIVMENELPDYLQYDFGLTK